MLVEREKIQRCVQNGKVVMKSLKKVNFGVYLKLKQEMKRNKKVRRISVPLSLLKSPSEDESTDGFESSFDNKTPYPRNVTATSAK